MKFCLEIRKKLQNFIVTVKNLWQEKKKANRRKKIFITHVNANDIFII